MRPDMFKVIVERPRSYKGGYNAAAARRDDHGGPTFLGMRAGYDYRSLNENLAPLRGFLLAQRGRPWNKVYSELRAHIDARSTVKRHVLEHLAEFVAINTWLQDGQIWYHNRSGAPQPLQSHSAYGRFDPYLYVDPRGGILREIPGRSVRKPHRARKHRAGQAALDARRRILSDTEQLLAIDGIWYHIVLAKLPEPRCVRGREVLERHWDVVRSAWVSAGDAQRFREEWARGKYLFGSSTLYAVSKRQLGKRELRAAGLSR